MKKLLSVLKYIFFGLLGIILCLNIIIVVKSFLHKDEVPSILGYKPFAVLSGSMQSNINVGDLVIVKKVNADSLKVDDIIAFRDSQNTVTTHRIIDIVENDGERCFVTKGDSNNVKDEYLVCPSFVEGKYQFKIPKLGNVVIFIQQPLGFAMMMLIILFVGVVIFFIQNKKIDRELIKENEQYLKEFEEFKRAKELASKKESNNDSNE